MKSCWQENPLKRPTFACIVEQLEKILSLEYKVCIHVQNETFLIFILFACTERFSSLGCLCLPQKLYSLTVSSVERLTSEWTTNYMFNFVLPRPFLVDLFIFFRFRVSMLTFRVMTPVTKKKYRNSLQRRRCIHTKLHIEHTHQVTTKCTCYTFTVWRDTHKRKH